MDKQIRRDIGEFLIGMGAILLVCAYVVIILYLIFSAGTYWLEAVVAALLGNGFVMLKIGQSTLKRITP